MTTNTLALAAHDDDATTGDVNWAVRDGCPIGGQNFAGGGPDVDDVDDPYTWTDAGEFAATIDLSDWDADVYCFIFNPTDTDTRLTQEFYVVDGFAKVGGTIAMGEDGRGNSPTHAAEGLVGDAGDDGIVGEISVNYRELDVQETFVPAELDFSAATGVGASDPMAKAVVTTQRGAQIQVGQR